MRRKMIVGGGLILVLIMETASFAYASEQGKPYEGVTLTVLSASEQALDGFYAVVEAAEEKYGFTIEMDMAGSGGGEYNKLVETRLASGKMDDMMIYNSGALFLQLNPEEYFVDVSQKPELVERLDENFVFSVSSQNGVYGIPFSSSQAGGILYNKEIYRELGLTIPHTWDEFIENCQVIQNSGRTAILGAYMDQWPEVVPLLGDYYNVYSQVPRFAEMLLEGLVKFSEVPSAVDSLKKVVDIEPFLNSDCFSVGYAEGYRRFAEGKGAHFIMLSQVLSNIYSEYGEEVLENIGVFGIPGQDEENHGLTMWMPNGIFLNKDSEYVEAGLAFFDFYTSEEGLTIYTSKVPPDGPFCLKGYELPEDAYPAVKEDIQKYIDEGKTCPAMEFISPLEINSSSSMLRLTMGEISVEEAAREMDNGIEEELFCLGLLDLE